MNEFKKKNKNSFWHSPFVLVILLCVVVVFAFNMVGLIEKEKETAQKKALILDEIDTLNKRETMLRSDINKLNTDDGIEDAIRDKYQVVKPGEKMVVIVDDKKPIEVQDNDPKNDHTFWGWVKNMFNRK